ncbi:MAG: hypothetical protein RLZZ338_2795 [Cyanobacteriota bacterium]|jgi:5-histidylcysteine sulfoxide synthase/putative 4-mercaptohistidine N1-methyltranferase
MTRNPNLDILTVKTSISQKNEDRQLDLNKELIGERPEWWWTGKPPKYGICPGVHLNGKISSLPILNLEKCSRQDIFDYFDNTWTLTEVLFSALQGVPIFYQSPYHQLRHPLIFYYCHPAVFYINKLLLAGILTDPINPYFEQLFETGVDEMSWDDLSKNEMEWPSIIKVHQYRKQVYETIKNIIETSSEIDKLPITPEHPMWTLFMGFEHERIHLETSSVLIREFPLSVISRPKNWPENYPIDETKSNLLTQISEDYIANKMIQISGQEVSIGKPYSHPTYGWDNEYGLRTTMVEEFSASQFLVSNGEFYQFVKDGGYNQKQYWTESGWKWRIFRNVKWPTFWVASGAAGSHQYQLRTCFELINMPWSWPVIVNYHEAKAYCAWLTEKEHTEIPYRVITESEHHLLRDKHSSDPSDQYKINFSNKDQQENKLSQNINLAYGSESTVNALLPTDSGFYDVFGNIWEWCEDDFNPLPGFKIHPIYDDFSTPCFDGEHKMIMGGSFISTGDESSIFARFHFRPHFFQHAGFRLARSEKATTSNAVYLSSNNHHNVYENQMILNEYLLLHYGSTEDTMPYAFGPKDATNFPSRCAQLLTEWTKKLEIIPNRALDLGCAVGKASFELAKTFKEVIGLDLSANFIAAANTLKQDGNLTYFCKDEGDLGHQIIATLDPKIERDRVTFQRADACAIPPYLVGFDAVLVSNLLCRLPSPKACLSRMGGARGLVKLGGILVVISPYTWLEDFTPKDVWLGGYKKDGIAHFSADEIQDFLKDDFALLHQEDIPLIIREHRRKYQYIVSHAMIWQRI